MHKSLLRIFWLLFSLSLFSPPSMAEEAYALLIGIDEYKSLPPELHLKGCVNDIELFRDILIRRFGFPADAESIRVLKNHEASRQGILEGLEWLVQKAQKAGRGAKLVLFYSGHGSQKPDQEDRRDEPDGKDETIISYDSTLQTGENDILDEEVETYLNRLNKAGAYVTVIYDCCHSGTGTRGIRTRSVDRPIAAQPVDIHIARQDVSPNCVFLSACQSYEKEPEFHAPESGKVYGMLTYHLVKTIEQHSHTQLTWRSIMRQLKEHYKCIPQSPMPQLEGDRVEEQEVLGVRAKILPKTVQVKAREEDEEDTFILDGGYLRGVVTGSLFCLVPDVEKIPEKDALPGEHILVEITAAEPFESWARVVPADRRKDWENCVHQRFLEDKGTLAGVLPGWDAVELVRNYGDLQLKVYIEKAALILHNSVAILKGEPYPLQHLPQGFRDCLTALEKDKVIQRVQELEKADVIWRIGKEKGVFVWAEGEQEQHAKYDAGNLASYEPKGIAPIFLVDTDENRHSLRNTLIHWNKLNNLLKITPPEESLDVSMQLVQVEKGSKGWKSTQTILATSEDQTIVVTIPKKYPFGIQLINKSRKKVYPTVFYITSSLGVRILFPQSGRHTSDFVPPGQDRLLVPLQTPENPLPGRETIKILATTIPHDFHELSLPELPRERAVNTEKRSAVGQLFFQAVFGEHRAGIVGKTALRNGTCVENPPDWTVLTVPFQVKAD